MPTSPTFDHGDATGFVLDQFQETYDIEAVAFTEKMSSVMSEWPTQRPTETYTYIETAPYATRWVRGDPRTMRAMTAIKWTTDTHDWNVAVQWHENDARDYQGRDLPAQAQQAGRNAVALDIEVGTQIREAATNSELLPSIPNAPDGAAMFATTAGGADRFGRSGGNIFTGTGVTELAIEADFFGAMEAFLAFQNTRSKPLFKPDILKAGIMIEFPIGLLKEFERVFKTSITMMKITGDAATTNDVSVAAGVSNVILAGGYSVSLFANPWLTDASDWYMTLEGSPVKPLYKGVHEPWKHDIQDRSNSDEARREKMHAVMWDARFSYGVALPFQSMKVNNS